MNIYYKVQDFRTYLKLKSLLINSNQIKKKLPGFPDVSYDLVPFGILFFRVFN